MICHRNGKAMTAPPSIKAACTKMCGCRWKKPSSARRVRLRTDRPSSRVMSEGATRSDIVHPPVLEAELEEGEECDNRHDSDSDHRGVALVIDDEALFVEQEDHGLGLLHRRITLSHQSEQQVEQLECIDRCHHDDQKNARR